MSEIKLVSAIVDGNVGLVVAHAPPVNALSNAMRAGVYECFDQLTADEDVRAIIILCEGRTFFAGADIAELDQPEQFPSFNVLFNHLEASTKPVIAAIHGTALGGGLELALASHFRIAIASAQMGLPEVKLGILPGAGGTQRLPRLVGPGVALNMITSGQTIGADAARDLGLIDAIIESGDLREQAVRFARAVIAEGRTIRRLRDLEERILPARNTVIFEDFQAKNAHAFKGFAAPAAIVEAIRGAVNLPFDEGLALEKKLFHELVASTSSAAQRYVFFAEREALKIPDVPSGTATLPVEKVGVVGAGTMGGGITMNFLNVGVPVTLVETSQAALDRGIHLIRSNYEASVRKGRLRQDQVEDRMALIESSLSLDALATVDLAIEAVFEDMDIKKSMFRQLDKIVQSSAILATNTSFLNIDEIGGVTRRPQNVIGLHFFSPANVMPLLEVVRGERTSPEVIATAMKLAKKIGKKPILSRVCRGFIANRLMDPRLYGAESLTLEGPTPADIDRVMRDFGFAMGPFQMIDLVGLDVIDRGAKERNLRSDLVARDRFGQKRNGGFYDYDERRRPSPSPVAIEVINALAASRGIKNGGPQADDMILARLLYPVVNEGARILEEGIALRASDIDVAAVLGYGWPVYTGGPMFWADTIGLAKVVERLRVMEARYGKAFRPAKLLSDLPSPVRVSREEDDSCSNRPLGRRGNCLRLAACSGARGKPEDSTASTDDGNGTTSIDWFYVLVPANAAAVDTIRDKIIPRYSGRLENAMNIIKADLEGHRPASRLGADRGSAHA